MNSPGTHSAGTPGPAALQTSRDRWNLGAAYLLLALLGCGLRLAFLPLYTESYDGVYFLRGLADYSLPLLQPQWPGYAVYIWVGRLVNLAVGDPALALHGLSAVCSGLGGVVVADLARRFSGRRGAAGLWPALLAGVLWTLGPLSLIGGTEIFSDPLANLLALVALWLTWQGRINSRWLVLAAVTLGIMLGVRIAYLPLVLPTLYLGVRQARQEGNRRLLVWLAAGVLIPTAFWLGWQIAEDGRGYLTAAGQHLSGHYRQWGGSVATDQAVGLRPVRLLRTAVVYGLGGWWPGSPGWTLAVSALWTGLLIAGARRLWQSEDRTALRLTLLFSLPYLAWVFVSHDVTLDRYFLPVVAVCCVVAGAGVSVRWGRALVTRVVASIARKPPLRA